MFIVGGVTYADEDYGKKVQRYLSKGLDRKTAEYFASGRKKIISVVANDDFTLRLKFDNGEERMLDCKLMLKIGTVFAPFMELQNFKRVYNVDSNEVWENKVDLCSDSCYMDSVPFARDV